MKKKLGLLLVCIAHLTLHSQNESFKGVPLTDLFGHINLEQVNPVYEKYDIILLNEAISLMKKSRLTTCMVGSTAIIAGILMCRKANKIEAQQKKDAEEWVFNTNTTEPSQKNDAWVAPWRWGGRLITLASIPSFISSGGTHFLILFYRNILEKKKKLVTEFEQKFPTPEAQQDAAQRKNALESAKNDGAQGKKYYTILGVSPNANDSTIKAAYLKHCRKKHPDKNDKAYYENTNRDMAEINQAYHHLKDSGLRKAYNDGVALRENNLRAARMYGALGKNCYTILGISPNADLATINDAYRKLAAQNHYSQEIKDAWIILIDPELRKAHDTARRSGLSSFF